MKQKHLVHVAMPSPLNAGSSLLAATILLATSACFPYHGKGGALPVSHEPLAIVDIKSRASIERVLVLPRYSSSSGISTLAGHGPGAMGDKFYVAHSFVYQQGFPFAPSQPSSTGIVWGWFWGFTGTGKSIDGVLLVARGYKSLWFYDLWSRSLETKIEMTPLSRQEALIELQDIQRLLGSAIINGESTLRWSLGSTYPLYVRIDAHERTAVDAFLSSGIASLGAPVEGS
jgi:hypothetical protein